MKTKVLGLVAVGLFAACGPAMATTITYDFSVTASSGPLAGTAATGSFAINSSIIPAGGGEDDAVGLLTNLTFTWDGTAYSATTANTGFLDFDAAGDLTGGCFGNNSIAGNCLVNSGQEQWLVDLGVAFFYSVPGADTSSTGTASYSVAKSSVPEPATLSLLGLGLAGVGFMRRRKSA